MNIGVDFHDTITYSPDFFRNLFSMWAKKGKIYIITGAPEKNCEEIISTLENLGFTNLYDEIIYGFEYSKKQMDHSHFLKMRSHKLKVIREKKIDVYFDDNPYYVEYIRNHGILVFQTVLSDLYMEDFAKKDPYFTSNLQKNQFLYLKNNE
jgi:hypothetical protein